MALVFIITTRRRAPLYAACCLSVRPRITRGFIGKVATFLFWYGSFLFLLQFVFHSGGGKVSGRISCKYNNSQPARFQIGFVTEVGGTGVVASLLIYFAC